MRSAFASSRSLRFGGLIALALPLLSPAATSACAETLRVHYAVSLIGLPIGVAGFTGVFAPTSYRIDVNARLTGLAGLLTSSRGAATAEGAIAGGRIIPVAYAVSTSNSDGTRTVRMSMSGGAVRGVDISPPIESRPDRIPLTEAHKRGVIDPMSALLMPVPEASPNLGPSACNRTLPIFDGYTRFDISLSYVGQRQVKTKGYAGPVAMCAVRYTPIAGHRPDKKNTQFMADNRQIETWLAPVGATRLLVPYRISVKTQIGTTVIEASDFAVDQTRKASAAQ
ncbi:MAG: DUF3108 domain-containing protein [Methylobacteriaceae bacterium]|nr:DUF3108 domain-containing protein [Methylobacteriaceae bacterium]MBV9702427.1 DUF3108 domain-containing protein [Methylobacteriaceae bacterium]